MSGELHCVLVTPDGSRYAGTVWQVTVPGTAGRFSMRKDHAPVVAALVAGNVEIAVTEQERRQFGVSGGVLRCRENRCTILCPEVTAPSGGV